MSLAWPFEKETLKITRIANGRTIFCVAIMIPKK